MTKVEKIAGCLYYADGPYAGKLANIHTCPECGKRVKPSFKGVVGDPESYMYPECSVCDEVMCQEHLINDPDEPAICSTCYQGRAIRGS